MLTTFHQHQHQLVSRMFHIIEWRRCWGERKKVWLISVRYKLNFFIWKMSEIALGGETFLFVFFSLFGSVPVIFLLTCIKQLSAHYGPSESCAFIACSKVLISHHLEDIRRLHLSDGRHSAQSESRQNYESHTRHRESDVPYCGAATETSNDLNLYCMDCWQVLRIRIAYTTFHWLIVGEICMCVMCV